MIPLAHQIAAHLPGWTVITKHDGAAVYLSRPDGALIHVRGPWPGWPKGRVTFTGCWPQYADGTRYYAPRYEEGKSQSGQHEITCAVTRTPEAMAKDILRRLLPAYDPAFTEALAFVRKNDVHTEDAGVVARRIASAIGGTIVERTFKRTGDAVHLHASDSIYRLHVTPGRHSQDGYDSDHIVSFEFRGSPEVAAQMLALATAADAARDAAEVSEERVRIVAPVRDEVEEHENEEQAEMGRRMAR